MNNSSLTNKYQTSIGAIIQSLIIASRARSGRALIHARLERFRTNTSTIKTLCIHLFITPNQTPRYRMTTQLKRRTTWIRLPKIRIRRGGR